MKKTLKELVKLYSKVVDTITKNLLIGTFIVVFLSVVGFILFGVYKGFMKLIEDPIVVKIFFYGIIFTVLLSIYKLGKKYREEDDE